MECDLDLKVKNLVADIIAKKKKNAQSIVTIYYSLGNVQDSNIIIKKIIQINSGEK